MRADESGGLSLLYSRVDSSFCQLCYSRLNELGAGQAKPEMSSTSRLDDCSLLMGVDETSVGVNRPVAL